MLNDANAMPIWGIHCATLPFTPTYTRIVWRTRWTNLLTADEAYRAAIAQKDTLLLEADLRHFIPDYGYADGRVRAIIEELKSRGYYLKPHVKPLVERLLRGERVTMYNPDYGVPFDIVPLARNAPGGYNGYSHCPPGSPAPRYGYRAMSRARLEEWLDGLEPADEGK